MLFPGGWGGGGWGGAVVIIVDNALGMRTMLRRDYISCKPPCHALFSISLLTIRVALSRYERIVMSEGVD